MTKDSHIHGLEVYAPSRANPDGYLALSKELAQQGETDHALNAATAAYDIGMSTGDSFLAGRASGLASFVAARGGIDADTTLTFGEQSQAALPANQLTGDRQVDLLETSTQRCRAAARVMLRNNVPRIIRPQVTERAISLLEEDGSINAEFKRAIVIAITGGTGAHRAIGHTKSGVTEAWTRMPGSSRLDAARHAGKEALISAVTVGFVAPQALGRIALPLRPLQRKVASEILG